jgi:hypothetical protein
VFAILSHQVVNCLAKEGLQAFILFDAQYVQGIAQFMAEVACYSLFVCTAGFILPLRRFRRRATCGFNALETAFKELKVTVFIAIYVP